MGIIYDSQNKIFHLNAYNTSYIIQIVKSGYLAHLYWGRKIRNSNLANISKFKSIAFSPTPDWDDNSFSLDTLPQEYPAYGNSDYRVPAYQMQLKNGSTITDAKYKSHKIYKGKPKLQGLPATYIEKEDEAQTLEIELIDDVTNIKIILSYTVYEDRNVITRNTRIINDGKQNINILRALSMSMDFDNANYDLLHLHGAWGRERYVERCSLGHGIQAIESRRGASSHQHNPFVALLTKDANEDYGEVYGFNLVYSGNFIAQAEVDQCNTTRVSMGINPFDFTWLLEPKESFQTPEVVMVYSSKGIGDMSRTYHDLYRNRLCRGQFRDKVRPVLINNWEATYFDFNEETLKRIAKTAKELGLDLFVLDDGWFAKRNNDDCSLGDWYVNKNKIPSGINGLAESINKLGVKFGLWFEPEMISPDSDLYRKHPDWCLHVPDRRCSLCRNQLILDFSRKDVCDEIIKMISDVLSSAPITYVKWDMNRNMTEIGSAVLPSERQRETAHRYMLGMYRTMEELTTAFPNILFEGCSGGGGRFDPGILYYMPQIWTSDDSDAIERLKIQYGTSIVYPVSTMGSHVSAVPNHQVERITPLETRGYAAMSGIFGYELDLSKLSEEEKETVKEQIKFYKSVRHLILFGDFYRIKSPFEGNETAWMFVSKDKSEAFVVYFQVLSKPNPSSKRLCLKGLDSQKNYKIVEENIVYGGDELMYIGLNTPELRGDFKSIIYTLKSVN